jgi:hypothetical protein
VVTRSMAKARPQAAKQVLKELKLEEQRKQISAQRRRMPEPAKFASAVTPTTRLVASERLAFDSVDKADDRAPMTSASDQSDKNDSSTSHATSIVTDEVVNAKQNAESSTIADDKKTTSDPANSSVALYTAGRQTWHNLITGISWVQSLATAFTVPALLMMQNAAVPDVCEEALRLCLMMIHCS